MTETEYIQCAKCGKVGLIEKEQPQFGRLIEYYCGECCKHTQI